MGKEPLFPAAAPVSGESPARAAEEKRIQDAYARRPAQDARYSWFNPAQVLHIQERERAALSLLRKHGMDPLADKKILEVGCGTGQWLRDFVKWGARPENTAGVELQPARAEEARRLCAPGTDIRCGSAAELDFAAGSFDLVLQSTVFTSILDDGLKTRIAREMVRVLKPGGLVLWYDYHVNNPNNSDVKAVKRAEVRRLFPGKRLDARRVTLAPPLARLLAPRSVFLCEILQRVPFLCTHTLGVLK